MLRLSVAAVIVAVTPAHAQDRPDEPGDTIVVTATRSEQALTNVPADVTVKEIDELRRDGFTFGTDEFRGVPGVSFRRGEGDGDEFPFVSIRGSNGTDGYLTLIDGIPFVGNDEEGVLNVVPYSALQRVEIVKGPVSALYGRGALYGAVNYITRSPRENRVVGAVSAGSDDYYRAEASVSRRLGGNAGLYLSGFYEDYGGWREQGGRRVLNLFGKLDADLGDRTTGTLYANYADRRSEAANGLPVDANGRVIDVAGGSRAFLGFGAPRVDITGGIAAARIEHRASDDLTLTATGQWRRFDTALFLNFYDPFGFDPARGIFAVNGIRSDARQEVFYGEATADWRRGAHHIVAGLSGERGTARSLKRWSGENGFTPACGFNFYLIAIDWRTGDVVNRDRPCFVINNPQSRDRFVNHFWGAFVQDEVALSDRWFLTVGGRYDSFRRRARFDPIPGTTSGSRDDARAEAFSPKAALSWRYAGGQVYAAYGRGFNSNFGNGFEWDANQYARPEQRPTTLDSYEIGWKGQALGDTLRFALAAFHSVQRNRRQVIPNPAAETNFDAPSNLITFGDRYEVTGAEALLDIRPRNGTSVLLSYSHLAPRWGDYVLQTSAGPVDLSGTTPVGVARNTAYVAAEQRVMKWLSARAILEWYDDYAITQDNRVSGGGYELVTLNARIQPQGWRGMSLDLTLMNALDRRYFFQFGGRTAPTYAVPGPPRQFRATLRSAF